MKKDKVIPVRLTEKEYECITSKAKDAGISISAYLRERGLNDTGNNVIDLRKFYHSICVIKDHAQWDNFKGVVEECDRLWLSLK